MYILYILYILYIYYIYIYRFYLKQQNDFDVVAFAFAMSLSAAVCFGYKPRSFMFRSKDRQYIRISEMLSGLQCGQGSFCTSHRVVMFSLRG